MRAGNCFGERVQAVIDNANQIGDGVRSGVAWAVFNSEGFAGAVSEHREWVEPEPAFVVALRVFFLRVHPGQGGVDVEEDPTARVGPAVGGPHSGADLADRVVDRREAACQWP